MSYVTRAAQSSDGNTSGLIVNQQPHGVRRKRPNKPLANLYTSSALPYRDPGTPGMLLDPFMRRLMRTCSDPVGSPLVDHAVNDPGLRALPESFAPFGRLPKFSGNVRL